MSLIRALLESRGTVKLFRGDASHVDEFNLESTQNDAILGQGIYLTDSRTIAKDYTVKGYQDALYRSDEGTAGQPRAVMKRFFVAEVNDDINDAASKFSMAVMSGSAHVSQRLEDEVREIIGFHPTAHRHPQYDELFQKARFETRYAKAYLWSKAGKIFEDHLREVFDKAYRQFKQKLKGTKMIQTVLDELVILPADKVAPVSTFEVPKDYTEKTFPADEPMPDWMLEWIVSYMKAELKFDPNERKLDIRFNHPKQGEVSLNRFYDWIDGFKQHGMRFAMTKDEDIINVGGKGKNPTLLEFVLGTNLGGWLVYVPFSGKEERRPFWEALRETLTQRGYVGFHYQGGMRTGANTFTGGSPVKHNAYSFWDVSKLKEFRGPTENVGISATDPRLFQRFQFKTMIRRYSEIIEDHQRDLSIRKQLEDPEMIETMVDEWLDSGELQARLNRNEAS